MWCCRVQDTFLDAQLELSAWLRHKLRPFQGFCTVAPRIIVTSAQNRTARMRTQY